MKQAAGIVVLTAVLVILASALGRAGEMNAALKIDGSDPRILRNKFGIYGYYQGIRNEGNGLLFQLPSGEGINQTGVYSYFAVSGDCEAILTYQLLKVPVPKTGYGSGVGLAFDVGTNGGRGDLQRVYRTNGKSGYALSSAVAGKNAEEKFLETTAKSGRLALRRIKEELIFLAAEETGELEEIERMPFSDRTIRAVRFFADPGGSPTKVDVRVRQIEIRAEEITGGVAQKDIHTSPWWWLLLLIPVAAAGGLLFWFWRMRRQQSEDDEEETVPVRKAPLKKTGFFGHPK